MEAQSVLPLPGPYLRAEGVVAEERDGDQDTVDDDSNDEDDHEAHLWQRLALDLLT